MVSLKGIPMSKGREWARRDSGKGNERTLASNTSDGERYGEARDREQSGADQDTFQNECGCAYYLAMFLSWAIKISARFIARFLSMRASAVRFST